MRIDLTVRESGLKAGEGGGGRGKQPLRNGVLPLPLSAHTHTLSQTHL